MLQPSIFWRRATIRNYRATIAQQGCNDPQLSQKVTSATIATGIYRYPCMVAAPDLMLKSCCKNVAARGTAAVPWRAVR